MTTNRITKIVFITILTTLFGCGLKCIDYNTGMPSRSQTLKEAFDNKVFQFEMDCSQKTFKLYNGKTFKIKNVWVENDWGYECIDNEPVVKKDTSFQLIIDYNYEELEGCYNYGLGLDNDGTGCCLGGVLEFTYLNQDTLNLYLTGNHKKSNDPTFLHFKQNTLIDTIKLYKKKGSS